jgi:hypothetical protein
VKTLRNPDGSILQVPDDEYLRMVKSGQVAPSDTATINMQSPTGEVVAMPVSVALSDQRYKGWSPIQSEQATEEAQKYEYSQPGWQVVSGLSSLGMGLGGALAGLAGGERMQEDIRRAREENPGSALLGSAADIALTMGAGAAAGASKAVGATRAVQALRAPEQAATALLESHLGRIGAVAAREAAAGAIMGSAQHAIDSELAGSPITAEGMLASGALGALMGSATGALTERAMMALERRAVEGVGDRLLTRATRWLGPSRAEATRMRLAADENPLYREAILRTAMDDIPRIAGAPISELDATAAHRALATLREEIGNDLQALSKAVDDAGARIDVRPVLRKLNALAKEYEANPATRARAAEVRGFIESFDKTHEEQWLAGKLPNRRMLPFSTLADWRSKFGAVKQGALRGGDDLHPAIPIYSILSEALEDGIAKAAPKIAHTEAAQKITNSLGAPIEQLWAARNARFRAVADLEEIARRGVGREGANRTWSLGDRLFAMTGAYLGSQVGGPIGAGVGYVVSAGGGRLVRMYGDQWTASILRMVGEAAKRGQPMPITSAVQLATRDALASIRQGAPAAETAFARVAGAAGAMAKTATRRAYGAIASHYLPPIKMSLPAAQVVAAGAMPTGFESRTPQFAARLDASQRRAAQVVIRYAPPAGLQNASKTELRRAQHASDAVIGGLPHVLELASRGQLTPTHWAAFSEAYPTVANEIRSAVDDGDLKVPKDVERVLLTKPADPVIQSAIARGPQQPPPNRPMPVSTEAREFETRADRLENSI